MQITAYSVIKFRKYKAKGWVGKVGEWTDARRPVPRLWIRSAEERGERRYENRNTTTTTK